MLFLSLYTSAVKSPGPPSQEAMAKMGALVEKATKEGTLVYTAPLAKNETGGVKVRQAKGEVSVSHGPFSGSVLMGASAFALLRASSREDAVRQIREFLAVAGDGECELLQVLEMGPPPDFK